MDRDTDLLDGVPAESRPAVPSSSAASSSSNSGEPRSSASAAANGASASSNGASTAADEPAGPADDFTSATSAQSGAIIITINYVFSDENNPVNPNRTGLLVMTVPNVSANRDPRLLDEFVRLATQMAYSSIVNGFKDKGITLEMFELFPAKTVDELPSDSRNCSICFESYDVFNVNTSAAADEGAAHTSCKRRKLDTPESVPPPLTELAPPLGPPKYLSECAKEFPHYPVQMPCGHVFGQSCLAYWLKSHTTCPLCRDVVSEASEPAAPDFSGLGTNSTTISTHNYGILNSWNNGASNVRLIGRSGLNELLDTLHQNYRNGTRDLDSLSDAETATTRDQETHTRTPPHEQPQATARGSRDAGVFSNILAYIRRRRQFPPAEPLFPTGIASHRTRAGIETRAVDANSTDGILDFLNLRPLTEDTPNQSSTDVDENNNNSTNQSPDNGGAEDDDNGN